MDQFKQYLEDEFIIWNGTFGIRDIVYIGEIKEENGIALIWLDDPYEMVGPLKLEELLTKGEIAFEACIVMTKSQWNLTRDKLQKESYKKQQKIHQEFQEKIKHNNKKRQSYNSTTEHKSEKEYRRILSLPLEGKLEISQIKKAYRKIAKTTHPDVGGDHHEFVLITEAKEALLSLKFI